VSQATSRRRDNTAAISARRRKADDRIAAMIEDAEFMAETGETWEGAAMRLGIKPGTLEQKLCKAGRYDLEIALRKNANSATGIRRGQLHWGTQWTA
jgi:hypothetical protein